MIKTKKELQNVVAAEKQLYYNYMFPTKKRRLMAYFKQEPVWLIMQWQILSRKVDYYKYRINSGATLFERIMYLFLIRRKNILSKELGLEIGTENISIGLLVYHYAGGCVVNGGSIIGVNCHLHGNNCIGNAGSHDLRCPILGDNVMLGVGAKVIGAVRIADNVKIAAGAVVVKDILEEGCTVAGIPAKIVKHRM